MAIGNANKRRRKILLSPHFSLIMSISRTQVTSVGRVKILREIFSFCLTHARTHARTHGENSLAGERKKSGLGASCNIARARPPACPAAAAKRRITCPFGGCFCCVVLFRLLLVVVAMENRWPARKYGLRVACYKKFFKREHNIY
jgi:hypothetical protein